MMISTYAEVLGGIKPLSLDLSWADGARWGASNYVLDRHFAFNTRSDAGGLMWLEAKTSIKELLDYLGHTFEEALKRHDTLSRRYELSLAKGSPSAYGIFKIQQFWRDIVDLDGVTPVKISVVEHY
jgi:hypothetical protein